MDHTSNTKNMQKIKASNLSDNCQLIALDGENMYTNIDYTKGLQEVRDVIVNYPTFDPVINVLELSLKSDDFSSDAEWFLQKVGTFMGRNWEPRRCLHIKIQIFYLY